MEAAHAAKNATTVAKALAAFGDTIGETRHAADISLEIAKSLSSGTAEVREAINRLFEFAASQETMEDLPTSKKLQTRNGARAWPHRADSCRPPFR